MKGLVRRVCGVTAEGPGLAVEQGFPFYGLGFRFLGLGVRVWGTSDFEQGGLTRADVTSCSLSLSSLELSDTKVHKP